MLKFENIIQNLKIFFNKKNNKDIALLLKVKTSTFSNWSSRNTIPIQELYSIALQYNINLHWLLTGEGDMYVNQSSNTQTMSGSSGAIQAKGNVTCSQDNSQFDRTIFNMFQSSYMFADKKKKLDKFMIYLALANSEILK